MLHFSTITEITGHKISTYEQEDDLCCIEVLDDVWLQFFSWFDISIIPGGDDVLSLEVCQVGVEFFAQRVILVGVGDEDFVCHGMLLFVLMGPPRAERPIMCFQKLIRIMILDFVLLWLL